MYVGDQLYRFEGAGSRVLAGVFAALRVRSSLEIFGVARSYHKFQARARRHSRSLVIITGTSNVTSKRSVKGFRILQQILL